MIKIVLILISLSLCVALAMNFNKKDITIKEYLESELAFSNCRTKGTLVLAIFLSSCIELVYIVLSIYYVSNIVIILLGSASIIFMLIDGRATIDYRFNKIDSTLINSKLYKKLEKSFQIALYASVAIMLIV